MMALVNGGGCLALLQSLPNSEQLNFLAEQTPTLIPSPPLSPDPIKVIKTEASHLKINTSKTQAEIIDQNLLSSFTADITPHNGTPLSTKETHSRGKPQIKSESKATGKGGDSGAPSAPTEGVQHSS